MKKYLKSYFYLISINLILLVLLSLLNYFINFYNHKLIIIIEIISIFISSFILGNNNHKKAYLEGIKYSTIYIFIITIIKLIAKSTINFKTILIFIIYIIFSIIGTILGKNTKIKKDKD